MISKCYWALLLLLSVGLSSVYAQSSQPSGITPKDKPNIYANTYEDLQRQINDILRAVKDKDMSKEQELIHGLIIPKNSTWFMTEYGPGFGGSLAAAYGRVLPDLEQEIKTIYEGNVERGWMTPKLLQYSDPDAVNAPIDHFLNCMDKIVPLFQTAFHEGSTSFYMSQKRGENGKQVAGDLNGFFVYDQGGFRFIPMDILMKLPGERPVRITLNMNVMHSKLLTDSQLRFPEEAIRKHISGEVVVHLIVGTDGNIKELKVIKGDPILTQAVVADMKTWQFEPTTLDGDPVEVEMEVATPFTMN